MKSVTMATKREMSDYTVFFSVLGHKKFIHKILAKSESVRFQPLFKFFWCSRRIALKSFYFRALSVINYCLMLFLWLQSIKMCLISTKQPFNLKQDANFLSLNLTWL